MAQSLETLRSSKIKSIYGRELGIDKDGYLVGAPGLKVVIEDITTGSTGTTPRADGVARVITSGSSQGPVQINLPAPQVGVEKLLVMDSTSTGSHQFLSTPAGASILSASDGTTKSLVNLIGQGGAVRLMGLTTAKWIVTGQGLSPCTGSTGQAASQNVTYTTST
jgi:hypothetical protein